MWWTGVHTSQINLKIQSSQPDHVVLHIGGNDHDVTQVNEQYCEELVLKLVLLAETFISRSRLQSVTICELLPRHITESVIQHCSKVESFQTQSDPQCRAQSGDTVQSLTTTQND